MKLRRLVLPLLLIAAMLLPATPAFAWSNGDNSGNGYGTHDWVLYEAVRAAYDRGYAWVDLSQAQPVCDDPDTVLKDTYYHVCDTWGDTYGDSPSKVEELYTQAVAYRASGDFTNASKTLGLLAHYYADTCNPLHTDQCTAEDGIHSSYETKVQTFTDGFRENTSWLSSPGWAYVADSSAYTYSAASYGHGMYSELVYQYDKYGYSPSVSSITVKSVDYAVDGLTNLISSVEAAARLDSGATGVLRYAGSDRFATSAVLSSTYFTSADTVIIASGKNYPDALAGSALAGTVKGPVLLVDTKVIPTSVSNEIGRLGATKAYILGGTSAVSASVQEALASRLGAANVQRVYGSNRQLTSQGIAAQVKKLSGGSVDEVFVANGWGYADALAASSVAAARGIPIILSPSSTKDTARLSALYSALDVAAAPRITIVGGAAVVGDDVKAAIQRRYPSALVQRAYGIDRYATANAVANYALSKGMSLGTTCFASGTNYPDALAGGAACGQSSQIMLLVNPLRLKSTSVEYLSSKRGTISTVAIFGGSSAVTQFAVADIANALSYSRIPVPSLSVTPYNWKAPVTVTPPPPPPPTPTVTVYVTATGEKYHRAGCRYLSSSSIAMTLSAAKAAGYTPCSVCDPPQ